MVLGTSGPHNATLCPRIPTIVSTLYLIRHGQASFGTAHYDRLSALGREQVTHLREHLPRADFFTDKPVPGSRNFPPPCLL